jgi:periplasmic protein TonB
MIGRDLWIGIVVSLTVHLALWGGAAFPARTPRAHFERGREAVALTLLPSVASAAAVPPPVADPAPPPREPEAAVVAAVEDPPRPEPGETVVDPVNVEQEVAAPALDQDGALTELGVEVPVRLAGGVQPAYPFLSRRRGEQGRVTVEVEVLADGRAGALRIVSSSGYPLLDEAALRALRETRFEPASRGGRPVRAAARWVIVFRLD